MKTLGWFWFWCESTALGATSVETAPWPTTWAELVRRLTPESEHSFWVGAAAAAASIGVCYAAIQLVGWAWRRMLGE